MQPGVVGELGMERRHHHGALAAQHGLALDGSQDVDAVAHRARRTGARMNTAWTGPPLEARHVEVGLERVDLAAEGVAADGDVDGAEAALVGPAVEDLAAEQDHAPRRCRSAGMPPARRSASGSNSPEDSSSIDMVVDSPPGSDQGVDAVEVSRRADRHRLRAETCQHGGMSGRRALQREHADLHLGASILRA